MPPMAISIEEALLWWLHFNFLAAVHCSGQCFQGSAHFVLLGLNYKIRISF